MRIKVEALEAGPEAHALKARAFSYQLEKAGVFLFSSFSSITSYSENASKSHFPQTKTVNTGGVITVSDFTIQCLSRDNDELLEQKSEEK